MKVDQNLNLVVAFERADGARIYVHASPISLAVFEEYALPLGQTFTRIMSGGYGRVGGPRMAARILKGVFLDEISPDNVELRRAMMTAYNRIRAEMYRLAFAIIPTDVRHVEEDGKQVFAPSGWESVPLEDAVRSKALDEEDVAEVDNALVFFTVNWRMLPRSERRAMVMGAAGLWGGSTTSSNTTEFAGSLRTWSAPASSGEKSAAAS